MPYKRKSWQEKMTDKDGLPKTLELAPRFPCYKPAVKMGAQSGDSCVLVNPSEVAETMLWVPEGEAE